MFFQEMWCFKNFVMDCRRCSLVPVRANLRASHPGNVAKLRPNSTSITKKQHFDFPFEFWESILEQKYPKYSILGAFTQKFWPEAPGIDINFHSTGIFEKVFFNFLKIDQNVAFL